MCIRDRYFSYQRKHYSGLVEAGKMTKDDMEKKLKLITDRIDISAAKIKSKVEGANMDKLIMELTRKKAGMGFTKQAIKDMAQEQVDRALATGDMSHITVEAVRNRVEADLRTLGEGSKIDKAADKKMQALEASKATIERIKALSGIPDELKKLSEKLAGLKPADIKKKVNTLFKTAKIVADAVNEGAKTHLKKLMETKIDTGMIAELELRLGLITKIASAVRTAVGSKIPGEATINDRVGLIAHTISKLAEKFGTPDAKKNLTTLKTVDLASAHLALGHAASLATTIRDVTNKKLPTQKATETHTDRLYKAISEYATVFSDVKQFVTFAPPATFTNAVLVMNQAQALGNSIPKFARGYGKKITHAKSILRGVADMIDDISDSVRKANLTGTVDLVKAMNGGGELNVKMETNTNLNATIVLKVSAAQLARTMVATPFTHNGTTNDYVSTKKFPAGVGNKRAGLPTGTHGE